MQDHRPPSDSSVNLDGKTKEDIYVYIMNISIQEIVAIIKHAASYAGMETETVFAVLCELEPPHNELEMVRKGGEGHI